MNPLNRLRNTTTDSFTVDSRNQLSSQPAGSCTYDARGNLINDAGKVLVYDDENQLTEWRESSNPANGAKASAFAYDGLGRMRLRAEYLGNGSSWVWQNTVRYVYDGRSVIQERDGDNWPQVAYTRGNDLSGTLEGAGGIGGLLARSHGFTNCNSTLTINITNLSGYCIYDLAIWDDYGMYVSGASIDNESVGSYSFTGVPGRNYYVFGWSCDEYYIQVFSDQFTGTLENHNVHFVGEGDWNCSEGANCISESGNPLCQSGFSGGQWLTHNYYHADGNGNITALESSAETLTASYRYDPFGNLISQSGGLATANAYRFSSKEYHANSGLYSYGFRFYSPNLQRWVNRDPIEENGGINLFEYSFNSPVHLLEPYGLRPGECYASLDDAARAALLEVNNQSIREQVEYGGFLYDKGNGKYTYGPPRTDKSQGAVAHGIPDKKYGQPIGFYHTHSGPGPEGKPLPGNDAYYPEMEEFSTYNGVRSGDKYAGYILSKLFNNSDLWYMYLATPTDQFKMWNTKMPGAFGVDKNLGALHGSKPKTCK